MSSSESVPGLSKNGRAEVRLGRNLEKHLLAYATAASAGLLAFSLPVEGQIVYTPSNTPMNLATLNGAAGLTPLDLNNDGTPDFTFSMFSTLHNTSSFGRSIRALVILANQNGNETVGKRDTEAITAVAVPEGKQIGPQANFQGGGLYMVIQGYVGSSIRSSGSWQTVETAYVGLKFLINGQVHYGWARVKFPTPGDYAYPSIYGYAYESTPNEPIITGQTKSDQKKDAQASLGMLATGSTGLAVWRDPSSTENAGQSRIPGRSIHEE